MADLSLKIQADFDQAQKQFDELSKSSEEFAAKAKELEDKMSSIDLNNFEEKQKKAAIATTAAKGELAAVTAQTNAYQREIERLIKNGMSPESDAVKTLKDRYTELKNKQKELEDIQKAQKEMMAGVEKVTLAAAAAVAALGAAALAAAQKTAEAGDGYAKIARSLGTTAEAYQELEFAARMSGLKAEDFKGAMLKLNKTMGDVKNGTGAVTKALENNNPKLLEQIKNAKNSEESFNLMMKAIRDAPDDFSRAEIATAAFGKQGQALINMAAAGASGLEDMREEARKLGIITNETAAASENYMDAQQRAKDAVVGLTRGLSAGLIPGMTDVMNRAAEIVVAFTKWITEGDRLQKIISVLTYVISGLAAGLIAFFVVAKGAMVIQTLTTAFKALNAAIAANPVGAIAVIVTTILIPAIIALYKNFDSVMNFIEKRLLEIQWFFKSVGITLKEVFIISINAVKGAFFSLVDFIQKNLLGAISKLLGALEKIPLIGDAFAGASSAVKQFSSSISDTAEEHKKQAQAAIEAAKAEKAAAQEELNAKLSASKEAADARLAELQAAKKANKEAADSVNEFAGEEIDAVEKKEQEKTEKVKRAANDRALTEMEILKKHIDDLGQTEAQKQNERIDVFKKFLADRLNAQVDFDEKDHEQVISTAEKRKEFLQQQYEELAAIEGLSDEQRLAAQAALAQEMIKIEEGVTDAKKAQDKVKLESAKTLYSGMKDLVMAGLGDSAEAAHLQKAIASAEAMINTGLAATAALKDIPAPANFAVSAGVIAAGVAQQIKIHSTPIPSAETGGRFIVPGNSSNGPDSAIMRVNAGEQIDVTPRGGASDNILHIQVMLEGKPIIDVMREAVRSGDLRIDTANV